MQKGENYENYVFVAMQILCLTFAVMFILNSYLLPPAVCETDRT